MGIELGERKKSFRAAHGPMRSRPGLCEVRFDGIDALIDPCPRPSRLPSAHDCEGMDLTYIFELAPSELACRHLIPKTFAVADDVPLLSGASPASRALDHILRRSRNWSTGLFVLKHPTSITALDLPFRPFVRTSIRVWFEARGHDCLERSEPAPRAPRRCGRRATGSRDHGPKGANLIAVHGAAIAYGRASLPSAAPQGLLCL